MITYVSQTQIGIVRVCQRLDSIARAILRGERVAEVPDPADLTTCSLEDFRPLPERNLTEVFTIPLPLPDPTSSGVE